MTGTVAPVSGRPAQRSVSARDRSRRHQPGAGGFHCLLPCAGRSDDFASATLPRLAGNRRHDTDVQPGVTANWSRPPDLRSWLAGGTRQTPVTRVGNAGALCIVFSRREGAAGRETMLEPRAYPRPNQERLA